MSLPIANFSSGQLLSIKLLSLLGTKPRNARSAYGDSKGRTAGDERHRQVKATSRSVQAVKDNLRVSEFEVLFSNKCLRSGVT